MVKRSIKKKSINNVVVNSVSSFKGTFTVVICINIERARLATSNGHQYEYLVAMATKTVAVLPLEHCSDFILLTR